MISFRHLLPRPVILILVVLGVLLATDLLVQGAAGNLFDALAELTRREKALSALQSLPVEILEMQAGARGFLLTGQETYKSLYRSAAERFPATASQALEAIGNDPAQRARIEEAAKRVDDWLEAYLSPLVVKRSARGDDRAAIAAILRTMADSGGEAEADRIRAVLDGAVATESRRLDAARIRLQSDLDQLAKSMFRRTVVLLVAFSVLALLAGRAITRLGDQSRDLDSAERSARESAAAMQAMNNASPLGMFVADASGMCTHANPAFERMAGMPTSALLGSGWQTALHPDDRDRVMAEWKSAIGGSRPFASEHRFLHRDGSVVWVRMKTAEMSDSGRRIGWVCTTEDVTDRRDLENALGRSEERLQIALDNSDSALFDWHLPSGQITFSPQWGRLTGSGPDPATSTSRRLAELVHPEDREPLREAIIAALKEGGREFRSRFRLQTARGQWKSFGARGRVTQRDNLGRAVQLVGTISVSG